MKNQPKVSIIIPVYNVEPYIRQCLESVTNQTLKEIEIIIVNDCSPANEESIIQEFMAHDDRIIYIKKDKNTGQGDARNIGITKASGEYIGFIDSDDYVDVTMFEKMYKKAKETDSDIVICNLYRLNCENMQLTKGTPFSELLKENDLILSSFNFPVAPYMNLYRSSFAKKYIYYPVGIKHEDVLPFFTGILCAEKINFVDEALYYYRLNRPGSTTSVTHTHDILLMINDVINLFKDKEKFNQYKVRLCHFVPQVYFWYEDKPQKLYDGFREIILNNFQDVITKNKRVLMFRKYSYNDKERLKAFYQFIYRFLPLKCIKKKISLYS